MTDVNLKLEHEDKTGQKISVNFQYRWIKPFTVTKKFSPVLYESIINKEPTVIHAINMKHDAAIKEIEPYLDTTPSPIAQLRKKIPFHQIINNNPDNIDTEIQSIFNNEEG